MKNPHKQYFIFLALIVLSTLSLRTVQAQDFKFPTYHREISLQVDNDALLLLPEFDKYYSSGIYLNYRRVIKPESSWFKLFNKKENLVKAIVSYGFEHRFYTSQDIDDFHEFQIDRPYAGWIDIAIGMNYHFKNNSVLKFKYDLGLLGPGTKSEELQVWFHGLFNMKEPRGWDFQINNTLATNFSASYQQRLIASNQADIIAESSIQVGTIRDNARAGLAFRFGELGDLFNSLFTQSKIGQDRIDISQLPIGERKEEIYFFFRIQGEYVVHNTTIDGNFIGTESAFTKISKPWVLHQEFGIGRGGRLFDFLFSFQKRTREIEGAKKHQYITIAITHRF